MKKLKYIIFSLILIIPLCVNAADKPKVTELNVKVADKTISYNGTMETGSHAVVCKLADSSNKEIDSLSSAVDKSKFSGSFTVASEGTYKVNCANYEGGAIKSAEAVVKKSETTTTEEENATSNETVEEPAKEETKETTSSDKSSPKTGDNFIMYAVIFGVGIVGAVTGLVVYKKKQTN